MFDPVIEPLVPLPLWSNVPTNPELSLYAAVVFDAVRLVRGTRHASATFPAKHTDVTAARVWIRKGNVGALTFNEACGYLGWDAEHVRQAIFSAVRGT
jgi:hypothetical protein